MPHMQTPVALQDTQIRTRFAHAHIPKMQSQEKNEESTHQADQTLSEEDTTAHCLGAMSNTKPDIASFALGMAAPPP